MAATESIEAQDNGSGTMYLIFGGLYGHGGRGTADLVKVIASPEEARRAFRAVRLRVADGEGWAELTEVSAEGRMKRLSWFGINRRPLPNPLTVRVEERRQVVELSHRRPRLADRRKLWRLEGQMASQP